MNNKLLYTAFVVAMAGFLFGFDTVVISGADQQLQELWKTSDLFHGTFVMSMALWGTVIGAIFAHIPCNGIGRKKTLFWIGVLYLISALGSGLATDPYTFSIFRFLGGLGVGASTVAAPTYVSEIAPAKNRGKLVVLYQLNIVLGILIAFISNYLLQNTGAQPWRWMVGIEALPALIYVLAISRIPESPRWLLEKKGDVKKAKEIYLELTGTEMDLSLWSSTEQTQNPKKPLFDKKYRFPLILAFLIAFFNQLSGINAFLYYAPRIFESAGLEASASLLSSIGIGVTNLLFTLLGLYLIDKLGRKTLMYIGSFGYIISLFLVAMAFLLDWEGIMVPIFLFLFIAAHAIGQGSVIWVFISEIFPTEVRAQGQSFGSSTHWVLAALITLFMPVAMAGLSSPGFVFLFFAAMMVLQLVFVIFMMPETKGKTLEELQESILK